MMISGLSIYLGLTIRLISLPTDLPLPSTTSSLNNYTYSGVSNYDFGPKDYDPLTQGVQDLIPNIAFELEFNSFGHFLYFFLPSIATLSSNKNERETRLIENMQVVCDMLGGGLYILYPTYNIIKRLVKHGNTFASSSYCNNGYEWATGAMWASAMGYAILCSHDLLQRRRSRRGTELENFNDSGKSSTEDQ
eukprot:CAMPEP_0118638778 /NCGR_PEP_ID=MMETSP0785-20121206/3878_1 /TAXON_ID=91992 /ORGANISM="Bolidomonas pacifica, Strain CCMP 1866" /LENGTH=191 /DNA_ID=CAMNT_0006530075 /DNA_START=316 /DNA_END=888 /DNA_ORIENTATION=-